MFVVPEIFRSDPVAKHVQRTCITITPNSDAKTINKWKIYK